MAGADSSDLGILERGENPGQQGWGPPDIVIRHDGDLGGDFGQGLADLEALVGNVGAEDADVGRRQRLDQLLQGWVLVPGSNHYHLVGLAGQDALQRSAKLLGAIVDGGDNNRHIRGGVFGLGRDRLGLVHPMTSCMNNGASIAP